MGDRRGSRPLMALGRGINFSNDEKPTYRELIGNGVRTGAIRLDAGVSKGNRQCLSGVYSTMHPFIAAVAATLLVGSVALAQGGTLPCKFPGPLLKTKTGELLRHTSNEMKIRAQHKTDLSGLIRDADLKGTAKADLLIGTSGEVVCLTVTSTNPLIKGSVARALSSWVFKPEREKGSPVAYLGRLEFFLCNIDCGGDTTGMTLLK